MKLQSYGDRLGSARAFVESLRTDVRDSFKAFARRPGLPLIVIASLGLATGAAAAAFSLVDAAILRPLPVRNPSQLISLSSPDPLGRPEPMEFFSYRFFKELQEAERDDVSLFVVSSISRDQPARFEGAPGEPEKIAAQWVSADAFDILGVKPALGRVLSADDDLGPNQAPVAVLSFEFWSRRLGRDPAVIGRWVEVGKQSFQIVGIANKDFYGTEPGVYTDMWIPATKFWGGALGLEDAGWMWARVWGRLRNGLSQDGARERMQPVFSRSRVETAGRLPPEIRNNYVNGRLEVQSAATGSSWYRRKLAATLWALAGVAGLVLLLACGNAANLLVVDGAARTHDLSVRVALGASRVRLAQRSFVESVLMAVVSCAMGGAFALSAARFIVYLLGPSSSPVELNVGVSGRMLIFVVAMCATVSILFGLLPAIRASNVSPGEGLKSGAAGHSARSGFSNPLVTAQVALCFLVLFFSGLFLVTFQRLAHADLGFQPENVILAQVDGKDLRLENEEARSAWRN
ncbi:MAG TPA: ABC transporter permease, partial [Blastocatellia bacterium]|nr:ABC transporter permease [Blastocatellia bacterium]